MRRSAGDFLLAVDKPEGPTSHDVVAAARRGLGTRRVGHTGTLDPFASGLLLLCIGRATRLAEYLSGLDKCYEAVARLGVSTDTLDRDGAVVSKSDGWKEIGADVVAGALSEFLGDIDQVPPQFSAKKVGGEAMHRKARRGEHVPLPPSRVTVHDIELQGLDGPDARFSVRCSSGTYIRAIARDLGEALGVGAHLVGLRRTAVGRFAVRDAVGLDGLSDAEAVARVAIEPVDALALPNVEVGSELVGRLLNGQRLPMDGPREDMGDALRLVTVSCERDLLAVAELVGGVLHPRKVFGP